MARVLVVDDESDMRLALRLFLERAGHTVQEASDGQAALVTLHTTGADVVLMDMRMPGMDGVQTLGKIRERFKDLPVIMVTGFGSTESASEVLQLGANHYISKPFKNQELVDALDKVGLTSTVPETNGAPEETVDSEAPTAAVGWSRKRIVSAAIGILLLAGVGRYFFNPNRDFAIPYSNPVSMTMHNGKLWVVDWFTSAIYTHEIHSRQLPLVKTYHMPNTHITGIAIVGNEVYTCDSWTKKISLHKIDDHLTVLKTFPTPGESPTSLFYDGKYLWSSDSDKGRIYQHVPNDKLTVIADYPAPGPALAGFFKDKDFAWSADTKTRKLYKHRLDETLAVMATYSYAGFDEGSEPLTSFLFDRGKFWYARERKGFIYRRSKDILKPEGKKS